MVKTLERTLLLDVGEMVVPLEFGDQGDPLGANWKEGNRPKRSNDFGTDASQRSAVRRGSLFCGEPRGRHQVQPDDFSPCLRRHDPGKVSRIGKKEKDALKRTWNPLLELNKMSHKIPYAPGHGSTYAMKR